MGVDLSRLVGNFGQHLLIQTVKTIPRTVLMRLKRCRQLLMLLNRPLDVVRLWSNRALNSKFLLLSTDHGIILRLELHLLVGGSISLIFKLVFEA